MNSFTEDQAVAGNRKILVKNQEAAALTLQDQSY
jgi:hypothetical protein